MVTADLSLPALEQEDFCQADHQVTLYQALLVTSPAAQLDSLLAHQEAPASAPLEVLEALPSAEQLDCPVSTLDMEHKEAV